MAAVKNSVKSISVKTNSAKTNSAKTNSAKTGRGGSETGRPRATESTELAGELRQATMRLYRHLRRQSDANISPQLLSALATVNLAGPITLGDLATSELVSPPSITKIANKLENLQYVSRVVDAADGRVQRLAVTAAGRRTLDASRRKKTAWLADRLAGLDQDDLAKLAEALPVLARLADTDPAKVAPR